MEKWKEIPGYEGLYEASDKGNIRNAKKGNILKPNGRYLQVILCRNSVKKHELVHRLVWSAFNGPIPSGMQVNHINEDKHDNRLENLNMMTSKENCNWGTRNQRQSKLQINDAKKSKRVVARSLETEDIMVFESAHEAARKTGFSRGTISNACRGLYGGILRGYKWKYDEAI